MILEHALPILEWELPGGYITYVSPSDSEFMQRWSTNCTTYPVNSKEIISFTGAKKQTQIDYLYLEQCFPLKKTSFEVKPCLKSMLLTHFPLTSENSHLTVQRVRGTLHDSTGQLAAWPPVTVVSCTSRSGFSPKHSVNGWSKALSIRCLSLRSDMLLINASAGPFGLFLLALWFSAVVLQKQDETGRSTPGHSFLWGVRESDQRLIVHGSSLAPVAKTGGHMQGAFPGFAFWDVESPARWHSRWAAFLSIVATPNVTLRMPLPTHL